jgi:hypothetical protein
MASLANADDFALDWWTVDNGGVVFATGGDFGLSGTIGQPDASPVLMTGGVFTLAAGFWPVSYSCAGDMNCDGVVDFRDINPFVLALTNWGAYLQQYPDCDIYLADINGDGYVSLTDINPFVALLTSAPMPIPCP